ncbi:hypothetical protein O181_027126 [Austropuccinia psidii MF-1]|uniref:Uncharacterized protein n=1 Tax=Austropuccinia psidii MF-1 TaxID=1389203 RepID=A0A9Q3CLR2_9BASI|nr:hypothetical protein [Austropuccinia psidii MF-1]
MAMARGHSSLGQLSPMGFKCQSKFYFSSLSHFSSRNHTDLYPLRIEPNQPNPPQQDSPVPSLPCKQTPWQPTQWLEDLFLGKQPEFHLLSTFDSSELTAPPFVEPCQTDEPPIPGPSPSPEPHEEVLTCEPEPEVAPTQSMEEPFGKLKLSFFTLPKFPHLSFDHLQLFPLHPTLSSPLTIRPSDPPSRYQAPLIPTMMLARKLPTYNQL